MMLRQLDTLIGFVVVMLVVSLLVTIITQMVSSLFGLRGKQLADALEVMIQKLDPHLDDTIREQLSKRILTRPIISDSVFSMADKLWDKIWILKWFRGRWKLASAIRPDELHGILTDMSGMTPAEAKSWLEGLRAALAQPDQFVANLKDLAGTSGLASAAQRWPAPPGERRRSWKRKTWEQQLQVLLAKAREASVAVQNAAAAAVDAPPGDVKASANHEQAKVKALEAATNVLPHRVAAIRLLAALQVATPVAEAAVAALRAQLPVLPRVPQAEAKSLIAQLSDASNLSLGDLEKWFNSAQDRAQQWFAMNARLITIFAAFVAAFTLQLDTFQLIKTVSADPDLRAKLVASADALQKQSEKVINDTVRDRLEAATHNEIITNLCRRYTGITKNLTASANFPSLSAAEEWLSERLGRYPMLWSFTNDYHQSIILKRLGASQETIECVVGEYKKTGLALLPDPYPFNPTWPSPHWWWFFNGQWSWPWTHLLGILCSAALLSLGAPFWFNTLKSLSSLRPILANEVDKDPKQLPTKA